MESILINNTWQQGKGKKFTSLNPANQQIVWQGNAASVDDVNSAISAARDAFQSWSKQSFDQRKAKVENYIKILEANKEEYAGTLTRENGKPLWEARTEVATMIAKYQTSVNSYNARTGVIDSAGEISSKLVHKAIGVMAIFGPFNFPGHLPNGHIIPALLAGNTVVHKPSELTPLCGELMARYWMVADLPKGVFNLVQGDSSVGEALVANREINGVLFTGSYNVGKIIHQSLAGRPEVMLALEMGGNNPLIVDDKISNIDAAVLFTIQSAFLSAGQRCTCARRLFIPDTSQGAKFLKRLVEVTQKLAISDGINHKNIFEPNAPAFYGPVISLNSKNSIILTKNNLIKNHHARELVKLESFSENSALLSPGILELPGLVSSHDSVHIPDQECFGPLLQVFRYKNFDDALDAANHTTYGLAAGLISESRANFELFYDNIKAGIVNWNRPTTGAAGNLPFGGIGRSGNYRPSAYYAADYCAYPMATQYSEKLIIPEALPPGVHL